MAAIKPGTEITLTILRDGERMDVPVITRARDAEEVAAVPGDPAVREAAGLEVSDLTPELRRQLRLPPETSGVLVRDVEPGSPAWRTGLRNGMLILAVNRQEVATVSEFDAALSRSRGDQVLMLVQIPRGGRRFMVMRFD